jgi:uncharacterized RDD family membrane protein YckC
MTSEDTQIDSAIDIVTPENIAFQYRVAGPFLRLPAFLIDLGIRATVWVAALIAMAILGVTGVLGGMVGVAVWLLVWFVMEWFYGGLLETFWNGQTVGKRLMGLRVLGIDGQPINGMQAVMRNILRFVDMMPLSPLVAFTGMPSPFGIPTFMIGLITPLLNSRFQRLGDVVCGTMVVVEEKGWLLETGQADDPREIQLAAQLPASFTVSGSLGRALATYVERRRFFSAARRYEIAKHLGKPLVETLGLPADTSCDLLLCALHLRTFTVDHDQQEAVPSALVREGAWAERDVAVAGTTSLSRMRE